MQIEIGCPYLITTNDWFVGPDGRDYRAVYGVVTGIESSEQTLGVKTNARSTNWYVKIGEMIIAGCQIHYAIKTYSCKSEPSNVFTTTESGAVEYKRPCIIYFA